VVYNVLELLNLSLTHLKLLVPLHELDIEVVDLVLRDSQLVLGVLEPGSGAVKGVGLVVTVAVGPHQLVIQLPIANLEDVVLLE
jgi:hypothetical protein